MYVTCRGSSYSVSPLVRCLRPVRYYINLRNVKDIAERLQDRVVKLCPVFTHELVWGVMPAYNMFQKCTCDGGRGLVWYGDYLLEPGEGVDED